MTHRFILRLLLVGLTVMFTTVAARAAMQDAQQASTPEDRTVPGFSATDSALMSIEHAAPLHAASLTLFSTSRKNDLMPRDIAVEVLPWLAPPGKATNLEQINDLAKPSFGGGLRRYLAFSLSISQDVVPPGFTEADAVSQIAFGVRTFLTPGKINGDLDKRSEAYKKATKELVDLETQIKEKKIQITPEVEQQYANKLLETRSLWQDIANSSQERVGFMFEVGGAVVLEVPNRTIGKSNIGRHVYWMNPIYRLDEHHVDFAGLIRYAIEPETAGQAVRLSSQVFDIGGRIGARRNGVYFSLEGFGRHRSVQQGTYSDTLNGRVATAITYGFSKSTQINFTFGKNFNFDFSHSGTLLAAFALKIGLGDIRLGPQTGASK